MPEVRAAPPGYRNTDPKQKAAWEVLGLTIDYMREELGNEAAFSVILSRVSRELRRVYGPDEAAATLRGIADAQHEAAKADLP